MQTVTTKATVKVAAVATGLAMAVSMFSFAPMAQGGSDLNASLGYHRAPHFVRC